MDRSAHIWIACTDCFDDIGGARISLALEALLDDVERRQIERFRFDRDRRAYLLSHGLCRLLLGRMLGRAAPNRNAYLKARFGKPRVRGSHPFFSISHSAPWVTVMISPQAPCGVDIEVVGRSQRYEALTRYCLSERERVVLDEAEDRLHMLLKIWTLKEAYLKAQGVGLTRAMTSFSVIDRAGAVATSDDGHNRMQPYHRRADTYHLAAWTVAATKLPVREHLLDSAAVLEALGCKADADARRAPAREVAEA